MTNLTRIDLDGSVVHILPVIKGLKSEADQVKNAFEKVAPEVAAVSLPKEDVEGLRNIPDDYEPELTRYDQIYAEGLSRFGEVAAPPPCYVATVEVADHLGIPLIALDLDDETYTDLYCTVVSGSALFRHSTRTWLLKRRKFEATDAKQYVLAWDRAINRLKPFRLIEDKRAETMASGILAGLREADNLLAIIELERAHEVAEIVRAREVSEKK